MQSMSRAMISSSAILILTILHHSYGAIIYSTPWRLHVVFLAGPVLFVLAAAWLIHRSRPTGAIGKFSKWAFVAVAGIVSFALFGLYEGGYNHAFKNVLYYGGASPETLIAFFPPPLYEMPNDFLFELTGVAQFVAGLWVGIDLLRLVKASRRDSNTTGANANLADALRSV